MNRYLFLDFHGVLQPVGSPVDRLFCQLELLESWLRLHPSVLVGISSSWRMPHPLDGLREFFSEDLRYRVVGATGLDWRDVHQRTREMPFEVRHEGELEVVAWLRANAADGDIWMALEDDVGLFRPGDARVVGCDPGTGLTAKHFNCWSHWFVTSTGPRRWMGYE
jgi:hypothetical protein